MDVSNHETMLDTAEQLLTAGQAASAGGLCHEVLEYSPDNVRALQLAARALRMENRQSEAVLMLQAIPAGDMTAEDCLGLGMCLQQLDRLEDARAVLMRAVDINPALAQAVKRLSRVNSLLGYHEEAAECCRRLIALRPESIVNVYPDLVRALLSAGQSGHALDYCNRILSINPAFRFALAFKYIALANLGRHEAARALINSHE